MSASTWLPPAVGATLSNWLAPQVAADQVRLSRRACGGCLFDLPELGPGATLRVQAHGGHTPALEPAVVGPGAIGLRSAQGDLWLADDGRRWLYALSGVDIAGAAEPALHEWLRASAAAHLPGALVGLFDGVEVASIAPAPGYALVLTLRTADHVLTTRAWAPASVWLVWLERARPLVWERGASRWLQWRVHEPITAARHALPLQTARRLAPGDIVLPQDLAFDLHGIGIWRCGSRRFRVRARARCLEVLDMDDLQVVTDDPENHASELTSELESPAAFDADTPNDPSTAEGEAEAAALALRDVPLTLDFCLGRVQCTLEELLSLAPGAVMPLQGGIDTGCVSVQIGGREVGRGELVDVEGRLGVRLTAWERH